MHAADDTPLAASTTYLIDQRPTLVKTERLTQGTTVYVEQQTGRTAAEIRASVTCVPGGAGSDSEAATLELPDQLPTRTLDHDVRHQRPPFSLTRSSFTHPAHAISSPTPTHDGSAKPPRPLHRPDRSPPPARTQLRHPAVDNPPTPATTPTRWIGA
jgi:hypothetical protein